MLDKFGISVHFSSIHSNYYSAWQYVTKEDEEYIESPGHPDLQNAQPPRTTMACRANTSTKRSHDLSDYTGDEEEYNYADVPQSSKTRKTRGKTGGTHRKRLSSLELSEIILEKKIKTCTELRALAREQKEEGKTDIAQFIVNRGAKVVAEVVETVWEMENSQENLERKRKNRIEILQQFRQEDCMENCSGQWLECAEEVLQKNGVTLEFFSRSV